MSLKDFEVKKIFDVDDLVLNIILTPKYVIMHDDENNLNWVTTYEEPQIYLIKLINCCSNILDIWITWLLNFCCDSPNFSYFFDILR
jgi:hypothetical protein